MAEVVDSIVAELIARDNGYTATFDKIIAKHNELIRTGMQVQAGQKQYEDMHSASGARVARDEEQVTQRVTRARKVRVDTVKQTGDAEVSAEAATQARLTAAVERGIAERAAVARRGGNNVIGGTVPREGTSTLFVPPSVMAGEAAVEQKEINHLLLDEASTRAAIGVLSKEDAIVQRDKLTYLNLYKAGLRANLTEEQAILFAEEKLLAIEKARAGQAEKQAVATRAGGRGGLGDANQFALQASGGRFGYSFGAGAVAGAAILGGGAIINSASKYGAQLTDTSQQLGLSTKDLQVYQAMAIKVGATNEQVSSSFGQLANNISRARDGDAGLQKIFKGALNIDVSKFHDLSDALPTIIDRLSKIKDPTERAAIGVKLFGDNYRRLDAILASGNAKIDEFGRSMGDAILTDTQIKALKDTSDAIEDVKHQLLVDFSTTVAKNKDAIIGLADSIGKLTGELLQFANSHPDATFGLIGAYVGGRFGLPGALAGATAGVLAGDKLKQQQADSNADPAFRLKQAQDARDKLLRLRASPINPADKADAIDAASREVVRQRDLLKDARASAAPSRSPAAVQPGNPNPKGVADAFAPKPPKGKSQDTLDREAAAREKRFQDEQAQLTDQYLSALEQLATSTDERFRLAAAGVKSDHDRRATDIDLQVKEHQIDAARATELKAANDIAYAGKLAVLSAQKRAEQLQTIAALQEQQVGFEREHLQNQSAFARTPQDRLRNRLSEIGLDQQDERDKAIRVLFDPNADDRDKIEAGNVLRTNQQRADEKRAVARHEEQTPLQAYADSLPKTAEEIRNKFEEAAVNGVGKLNDSLASSVGHMLHLHGLAGELLEDFIKIAIQAGEAQLFGGGGAPGGGGGFGGFFSQLLGGASKIFGGGGFGSAGEISLGSGADSSLAGSAFNFASLLLPGLAGGGTIDVLGHGGLDKNLLSLNGRPVARVNMGEKISVGSANGTVRSAAPQTTIVAPLKFDLTNAVMTPELLEQMNQISQYHARNFASAYSGQAVRTANAQAPDVLARRQKLGPS